MTKLNNIEKNQLGQLKGNFPYIKNLTDWNLFRDFLVQKSKKRNPDHFDENLSAYTPGETLELLQKKEIQDWFKTLQDFNLPENIEGIILVPCAASKPWKDHKNVNKSKLYKAYNQIIEEVKNKEFPNVYFLTISEPLGIVPQELWKSFPKYDNPGLFKDDFLRTGLVKTDWNKTFLKEKHALPFDEEAYIQCIEYLSIVIQKFLQTKCKNIPIISFVDAKEHTTHGDMLDHVSLDIKITRFMKKEQARSSPYDHLKENILSTLNNLENKTTIKLKKGNKNG